MTVVSEEGLELIGRPELTTVTEGGLLVGGEDSADVESVPCEDLSVVDLPRRRSPRNGMVVCWEGGSPSLLSSLSLRGTMREV